MKKNCSIIKDLLPLYKDNVVSKETKEYVEEHLKTCQDCQNYLEDLQYKVENLEKQDINVFKKFAKKIHIKLVCNTFLGILYFAILLYCAMYFITTYPFKLKYNDEMEIEILDNGRNSDKFIQLASPVGGKAAGVKVVKKENDEEITYLFVTWKSTLYDHFESLPGKMVDTPNIDFNTIDFTKKVRIYYTNENLKKIEKSSEKEWKRILEKSHLMFNEETKTTRIDCTLNDKNYSYTLKYYNLNNQVIEGFGGEDFPLEIQIRRSSIKDGESMSMWYEGEKASKLFTRTDQYIKSKAGSCSIVDLEE